MTDFKEKYINPFTDFERVLEVAEIAKFTHEEYLSYEDNLKYYRDMKNSFDTARDEGGIKRTLEIQRTFLNKA
jgi:hypothetical protein